MGTFTSTIPSFVAGRKVRASELQTLADLGTALTAVWSTTWTPTLTNLTLGNGAQVARYRQLNKTVDFYWKFTLGSTSVVGTSPQFTLPVAPASHLSGQLGFSQLNDASVGQRPGTPAVVSGSTLEVFYINTTMFLGVVTATVPFTWVAPDQIICWGTYEAA